MPGDMGPVPRDLYSELDCPKEDLCKRIFIPASQEPKEFFGMKPKRPFDDLHSRWAFNRNGMRAHGRATWR